MVPEIEVVADASGITIRDNGPGLPKATLKAAMDFTVRASNREAYVAPDRGAQGNALKTILPMPVVLDPDHGRLIVKTHGKRHVVTCGADPISQRAVVHDDVTDAKSKNSHPGDGTKNQALSGTAIRVEWSAREVYCGIVWPFDDMNPNHHPYSGYGAVNFADRFRSLVEGFAIFNPHATIRLDWFGEVTAWNATDSSWSKWKPCQPTSAHWYEQRHLERLIGAYVTHDRDANRDRLVSEFVAEFDGRAGSAKRKKVLDDAGLKRAKLSELVAGDRLDGLRIEKLLASIQKHTRPVNPKRLGIIGEDHLKSRLLAMGVEPDSFRYSRRRPATQNVKSRGPRKARKLALRSRSRGSLSRLSDGWVMEPPITAASSLGPTGQRRSRIHSDPSATLARDWRQFCRTCGRRATSRSYSCSTWPTRASSTPTAASRLS